MVKAYSVGDRVEISEGYHWAKGALATVAEPPDPVLNMVDGWHGVWREVTAVKGVLTFFWVEFDEPQIDADGDGPYAGAEIDSDYLVSAARPSS